jgi:hypothetical protein
VRDTEPTPSDCTKPELLTDPISDADELQVTSAETFWVVPSVNVPEAVSCSRVPSARVAEEGVKAIDTTVLGVTVTLDAPLSPA